MADTYPVVDGGSFTNAVYLANSLTGVSSTILLQNDIALLTPSSSLPTLVNPLIIDTGTHALTGTLSFLDTGAPLTIAGTFHGVDAGSMAGANMGGAGILTQSTTLSSSIINNGHIIGGGASTALPGAAVTLASTTFVNNGTLTGGLSTGSVTGGSGAVVQSGSSMTNYGTIEGGSSQLGIGGIGIDMGASGTSQTLVNYGQIRGGASISGAGGSSRGVGLIVRSGTNLISNAGAMEGGVVIVGNAAITLINSGVIRSDTGSPYAIAVAFGVTAPLTLELHAGSVIAGIVSATGSTNDTLRLGGNTDATFDVSQVGRFIGNYQGFEQFQKTGTSTWSLVGKGTDSTPWNVQQGTLQVGSGGTSGSFIGDATLASGATLAFNRIDAFTFANNISGTGSVSQMGAGIATLSGTNSYTGGTTIASGTLRVGSDANLGNAAGGIIFTGGVLNTSADMATARSIALNGNGTFFTDSGTTLTLNGVVGGNGGLAKAGAGALVLSKANTYTGGTTINAGELRIASDTSLGAAAGGVAFTGGTLHTTTDITTSRAMNLSGTATFLTEAGTTLTLDGPVTGSGSMTKAGDGTLVLGGGSGYTGGSSISAGTLQLGNGGASGSIAGDIVDNATLAFDRTDTLIVASTISGGGALMQNGSGTVILTGNNTYGGVTTIGTGALQLGNGGASGGIAGNVVDNGTLVLNRSDNVTFAGTISGSGSVVQAGTGATVFNGMHTYIGTTTIEAGQLAVNGSITSPVMVSAAGTLGGSGTIVGNVTNAGTVAPGNSSGTLTVKGNYIGQGGTLQIEAALGGDNAATDRLIVMGDTSGSTHVKILKTGEQGAPTLKGVKVVDVRGASNGAFELVGDYMFQGEPAIVSGAYAYRLYKNGVSTPNDGDWYLRSSLNSPTDAHSPAPLYAPSVPLYESYAAVLQQLNGLDTLQQRVGNRDFTRQARMQDASVDNTSAAWVRVDGGHADLTPETSTTGTHRDATTLKVQVGLDGTVHESEAGVLVVGGTMQWSKADSNVASTYGLGQVKTTGYGIGGTLTWYGAGGFYVDAQAQWNRYDTDLASRTLARLLADGNKGTGHNFGLEAGQKFVLSDCWSLVPQGQLVYSSVRFDNFVDPYGAAVRRQEGDSLLARAGLAVDRENEWRSDNGSMTRLHIYGIANLYYDFFDGTKAGVSGVGLVSEDAPLWGGVGLGGSLNWNSGRYRLYGEALTQTSLQHYGDSSSYGVKIGFRMSW
ncbi:autotransporter outer membrane beta-barrel domain-containing protein [Dyella subtropica]|uniref:autotransporter outer membrane beta-barrel domain-containing protein n=1 Tax=Dyella subtropica TaxID=2992127 RepID=UPI0022583BF4|nr:autotransporter outer membrane beta-barrel domain-containing protein [Dyella subtropica]